MLLASFMLLGRVGSAEAGERGKETMWGMLGRGRRGERLLAFLSSCYLGGERP